MTLKRFLPFIHPITCLIALTIGLTAADPVLKTAIAALFLFLAPEIIGGGILSLLKKNTDKERVVENWTLGALAIFVLFFLVHFLKITTNLKPILTILLVAGLTIRITINYLNHRKMEEDIDKEKFLLLGASLALAITGYTIWRINSPYPLPLNWDLYEHQTLINEIRSGNLHFLNSRISDSFVVDGYSPLFHILLAVPQIIIFETRILGFWWFVEFLQYFVTIAVGAFFAWQLTKDRLTALTMTIVTTFIFESFIAYSPLFLLPQTFASVLTIFALIRGLKRLENKQNFFDPIQILLTIVILLTHYIVGLLGIVVLITGFATHQLRKKRLLGVKLIDLALVLSVLVLIALPTITYYLDIELLQYAEAQHFNLDLTRKWELMRNWYGYSLLAFMPIGLFLLLRHPEFNSGSRRSETEKMLNQVQHDNLMGKLVSIICFGTLALVIVKVPYSLKFYVLTGFFAHFLMAIGIAALLKLIESKLLRTVFLTIIVLSFGLIFTFNQKYYKGILHYGKYTTHVSLNEIKATRWLEENYGNQKGVILVSDPATQGIMEALSGINTQGGVYANLATRRVIDQTYPNSDSKQVANLLSAIQDTVEKEKIKKILFVVGGRFFKWQEASTEEKESFYFNVWKPKDLVPENKTYLKNLNQSQKFRLKYQNEGVAVFEVNRY